MNPHLEAFANNKDMFEAVKDEMLSAFTIHVSTNGMTNEQLGEIVRARVDGSNLVIDAFRKMERFRTPPREIDEVNPGR